MKSIICLAILAVSLLGIGSTGEAKSIEEILKAKGVITEAEYQEATKKRDLAYYKPGKGITIETADGKTKAHLGGRIQVRYTYEDFDDTNKDDESEFTIRRMKVWLQGNVFSKNLKYKYQHNFGEGKSVTEDAYAAYRFADSLTLQLGQYKAPQGRQELTSSGKQLFVDRSLANDTFNLGRDIGLEASGQFADHMVEYRLGLFNGNGPNTGNPDNHHMIAARLDINPLGQFKKDEPSFSEKKPLLNIGGSFSYNKLTANDMGEFDKDNDILDKALDLDPFTAAAFTAAFGDELEITSYTANTHFKVAGLSLGGEYYFMSADPDTGDDWDADGYYLQAAYQILPKTLEVAARYSAIDSDTADASTPVSEEFDKAQAQVALNYYFKKHNVKLQADYTAVEDDLNDDKDDDIFRIQGQLIF